MGLPPEPPGEDPTEPEAVTPAWQPPPSPYTTSAFEGVPLDDGSGHEHHHHGHGAGKPAAPAEPPAHEHDHAPAKKEAP